jgi:uncharacterized protein
MIKIGKGVKKREDVFYSMFIDFMDKIVLSGEAFVDLIRNYENVEDKVANLKVMETECDMETHKILKSLHGSFITPFDREDIYEITRDMDEIVDCMEEIGNRMLLFDVKEMRPEAVQLADIMMQSIRELHVVFRHLHEINKTTIVREQIIEVNRLENEGDLVFRKAISTLFRVEKDPVEIIKWKHIFEMLEDGIDSCENVANIIEGVIMKYA